MKRIDFATACLPAFLVGLSVTGCSPATEGIEALQETVVHSSIRPSNWDLYLFDRPGSAARQLTTDPGLDYNPAFSPDGRWLVFVGTESGNPDIFTMPFVPEEQNAQGQATNLTRHKAGDFNPAFSPDGKRIVFSSNRDTPDTPFDSPAAPDNYRASDVYTMQSDGTNVKRLTRHQGWDGSPAWRPDGKAIFFYSQRDGKPRIYRNERRGL